MEFEIVKNNVNARLPEYKTDFSAGADLYSVVDYELKPNEIAAIDTGISFNIPEGYEVQIRPRSGLALKYGITVLNSPGTIDEDYTGPIMVILINLSKTSFKINVGDRIAQIVISPYVQADFIEVENKKKTNRGENGFGSTGRN